MSENARTSACESLQGVVIAHRLREIMDSVLLECYARCGCGVELMIHPPIRTLIGVLSLATLILLQPSSAFADGSSEPAWLEPSKFVASIIGLLGAAIAFIVGLSQYSRAQEWKRAEFLANEIKELLADRKAANALTMIDWSARRIKFDEKEPTPTLVTYEMQSKALLPHRFVQGSGDALVESPNQAMDEDSLRKFTATEALIRDCYDALLDRLDRLGSYLEKGLFSASDMRPYLGYYVDDLAAETEDKIEALWNLVLLTYVHYYHFRGIPILFEKFGHDITPTKTFFKDLVKTAGKENPQLAQDLARVANREWESGRETRPSK